MTGYNRTRSVERLLEKTESSPPSFTVHLHSECWVLNNGSKFLYNNQVASLLDDISAHRIPVDFLDLFDSAQVPFYEGCMIVELLDYRPPRSQEPPLKDPQKTRVVLHPNPETLWADLCSLNKRHGGKWTDQEALEIEAKVLLATTEPLCLDPDPHLTRIVNHVVRVSTPTMPLSLKRKVTATEPEEDGPEKAKRERLVSFMAPRDNKSHTPSYRLLDYWQSAHAKKAVTEGAPIGAGNQFLINSQSYPSPAAQTPVSQADSPHAGDGKGHKGKKINAPSTSTSSYSVAFVQGNGSHTPVPPQPTHQFVNHHPPNIASPGIQPQVYPSVKASTEAAAQRAATPAQSQPTNQIQQQQYMHYQQQQLQQQPQQPQQPQQQPPQQPQQPQPPQPQIQLQSQQQQHLQQRPPSQPHHPHPQQQQHVQQHTQPQVAHQPQQSQRFTQSPKPQPNAMSPPRTQPTPQPYPSSQFQPPIPNAHFLQQPPSSRQPQKAHLGNGAQPPQQQHPGPLHQPQNNGQLFAQQLEHSQIQIQLQQQQQQQVHQQQQSAQAIMQLQQQSRANVAISNAQKNGGRATPQLAMQTTQVQTQQQPHPRPPSAAPTATPSPARASPLVTPQQLAAGTSNRMSPMNGKAQLAHQGQAQQQQNPQQHPLASQSMLMQPARPAGTPQYSPAQQAQMRAMNHGTPPQIHMLPPNNLPANGTPIMSNASPRMNGRPITPAISADGKPQMSQAMMQGQTPIMRRQTPLQHAPQQQIQALSAASPQMQHSAQLSPAQATQQSQHQAALRVQQAQLVQAQAQAANQQAQRLQAQPQTHTNPVQMNPQMGQYPQMYAYPNFSAAAMNNNNNFWRQPGAMNNAAQNLAQQQQQQQQHHQLQQQQIQLQQQQQGVAGGQGMMVNGQNVQVNPQQRAMLAAQLAASQQQKAIQGHQMNMSMGMGPGMGPGQSVMGKMQPQNQVNMMHIGQMAQQSQAHPQHQVGMVKGKVVPKKGGPTAKKGPQR